MSTEISNDTEWVEIAFSGDNKDNAVLLLAAAEELGIDPAVAVRTTESTFVIPRGVANKAGLKKLIVDDESDEDETPEEPIKAAPEVETKPVKKAPAKKAAAKKSPAKK